MLNPTPGTWEYLRQDMMTEITAPESDYQVAYIPEALPEYDSNCAVILNAPAMYHTLKFIRTNLPVTPSDTQPTMQGYIAYTVMNLLNKIEHDYEALHEARKVIGTRRDTADEF